MLGLARGEWEYTETGLMDRTHLRLLTRATIESMFEQAGYRIQRIGGANSVWGQEWCAQRIEGRARRKLLGVARGLLTRWQPDGQFLHFIVVAQARS